MSLIIYTFFLLSIIIGLTDLTGNPFFNIVFKLTLTFFSILTISYFIIKKFNLLINFITIWFGLQRFVGLILASIPVITVETFRTFFLIKEILFIYIFIILFTLFIFGKIKVKLQSPDIFLIYFCFILITYVMMSKVNIWLTLLSFRRFIMLPLIYFIGRLAVINIKQLKQSLKFTLLFTYVICLFGLIDYFGARHFIYQILFNVNEYFNKQVMAGFIPIQWTFGDVMKGGIFIDYTFGELPRFVSTYLEPTTLGSFLSFVLLYSIFCNDILKIPQIKGFKKCYISFIINALLFLCIILTFSKGAFTILLCGSSFILYFNKKIPLLLRKTFLIGVYTGIIIVISYLLLMNNSGASSHIIGLKTGLFSAITHPFGLGLGNAGNFASLDDNSSSESVGGESAVGSMLGQLGLLGFIPYLLFIIMSIKKLIYGFNTCKNRDLLLSNLYITTAGAFLGYAINSLFTDSANGVTGNFYYFLFLGLFLSQLVNKRKGINKNEKTTIHYTANTYSC